MNRTMLGEERTVHIFARVNHSNGTTAIAREETEIELYAKSFNRLEPMSFQYHEIN